MGAGCVCCKPPLEGHAEGLRAGLDRHHNHKDEISHADSFLALAPQYANEGLMPAPVTLDASEARDEFVDPGLA
jgi:hypothetical protein